MLAAWKVASNPFTFETSLICHRERLRRQQRKFRFLEAMRDETRRTIVDTLARWQKSTFLEGIKSTFYWSVNYQHSASECEVCSSCVFHSNSKVSFVSVGAHRFGKEMWPPSGLKDTHSPDSSAHFVSRFAKYATLDAHFLAISKFLWCLSFWLKISPVEVTHTWAFSNSFHFLVEEWQNFLRSRIF